MYLYDYQFLVPLAYLIAPKTTATLDGWMVGWLRNRRMFGIKMHFFLLIDLDFFAEVLMNHFPSTSTSSV